jgi:hypothetical protein
MEDPVDPFERRRQRLRLEDIPCGKLKFQVIEQIEA